MWPQSNQDVVDARRAAEEKMARAIADVWDAIAERKRNREQESPQTKAAGPKAIHHRQENGPEMTTEGPAEMSCKQQNNASATETVTLLANEAKAARKGKSFQYVCPACQKS